jgi:peptide deformylase
MAFVLYPDPRLSKPAPLTHGVSDDLRAIGARLLAALAEAQAYGLAAAHIGEVAPIIALNTTPEQSERGDALLYNPRVVAVASETAAGREGSVSMPGIEAEIERPVWAEIAYETGEGEPRTLRYEGFLARCAIHEIEQMNGVFFLSHLSRLKRDMLVKRFGKLQRAG